MLPPMRDERLRSLMERINRGDLSRNKDFDAFRDPAVREARHRYQRLCALEALLLEADAGSLSLARAGEDGHLWQLSCKLPQWEFSWCAYLKDFELDMLRQNPEMRALLEKS